MSNLLNEIKSIISKYPGAYVSGSGKRTIEKQIGFVKSRPSQYPKTLRKVFEEFNLDKTKMNNPSYLKTIYEGKEEWLRKTILDFARRNEGYQHLSGNAIDVSVRNLSLPSKEKLKNELDDNGYHVIMEWISGNNSKYYVEISQANVFHIDLLNTARKQSQYIIYRCVRPTKNGPIYRLR